MNRRPVSSSNIDTVGWEQDDDGYPNGVLEVEFRSGHIYRYLNVPESVYRQLISAGSVGKFLNQQVIGRYDEERVS